VLVGDRTYGKFCVQTVIDVDLQSWGKAGLKLTTAKYHTLKSPCIEGKGLLPDFVVPSSEEKQAALLNSREQRRLRENNPRQNGNPPPSSDKSFDDVQLKKAVEVITSKLKK
jgi:carboxyl-terminal processing protease